ncbi:hypothetical protein F5144DRAFT_270481 [Chaetomium tenue]|uniref:Uncharacterized protein n=1 Tax=Chaetomium tenue TaxID=1854479 RepID=A0ACB7P5U2_9PEZI|nr:hypothetical protein F5144DRAFT_270481 [Chaetomium globosum]
MANADPSHKIWRRVFYLYTGPSATAAGGVDFVGKPTRQQKCPWFLVLVLVLSGAALASPVSAQFCWKKMKCCFVFLCFCGNAMRVRCGGDDKAARLLFAWTNNLLTMVRGLMAARESAFCLLCLKANPGLFLAIRSHSRRRHKEGKAS